MIRKKKGFTLIELMAAVAITVLVVMGSLLSFMHLMILADASVNLTIAVNDAQLVLEQLKGTPYGSILSYVAPDLSNLPNDSETITLTRSVGANLATVSVNVSWLEKGYEKSYVLSTCILK